MKALVPWGRGRSRSSDPQRSGGNVAGRRRRIWRPRWRGARLRDGHIRLQRQGAVPPARVPKGALYELRKMYYDTAQASNPVAMGALRKVVPVSQIVYGTDYWYRTAEETGRGLVTNKVFSAEELRMINRGNTERILPRYKGAQPVNTAKSA